MMELHAISTGTMPPALWWQAAQAVQFAGADAVHLREPDWTASEADAVIRSWSGPARLILNTKTAYTVRPEGIHLPEHAPPETVPHSRSVHSPAAAEQAVLNGAERLIAGPVYPPRSKPGAGIGIEAFSRIVRKVNVPVIAVGGIKPEHMEELYQAGAAGAAVITGMMGAPDPENSTRQYRKEVERCMTFSSSAAEFKD
ncbi:thiamine phosphate synthase [Alkalicoccus urumqiensis]|nr:thiamine phosphate synthase [Alkalicoccus urumqiensis]